MDTHRKYSQEQIEAELARPKKKGGRPRKYATEEERKHAQSETTRRRYWRLKNAECGIEITPDLEPRKQALMSDEERAEARRITKARSYQSHRDERTLHQAALYAARTWHAPMVAV